MYNLLPEPSLFLVLSRDIRYQAISMGTFLNGLARYKPSSLPTVASLCSSLVPGGLHGALSDIWLLNSGA